MISLKLSPVGHCSHLDGATVWGEKDPVDSGWCSG